ncbi:hypothetical protein NDU88_002001 [Pleurodeles waltl]|uniref:Uncharacterized protein n=1 Tax=Pleurodeles waltl TaxID=8319 RepID=A0AAV7SCH2_PLEWA|nr:hypothetical protein NDU88_002001 [Pleurodeles waltl]
MLPEGEDSVVPFNHSFQEALFAALRDDFQTVKRDLSQDLKAIHKDTAEPGDRVLALDDQETTQDEESEQLQQEVICLKDQQIDLQAHAEDLESRYRLNKIHIRGLTTAEEGDIEAYVPALFSQIIDYPSSTTIQLDNAHTVGLLPSENAHPADILERHEENSAIQPQESESSEKIQMAENPEFLMRPATGPRHYSPGEKSRPRDIVQGP